MYTHTCTHTCVCTCVYTYVMYVSISIIHWRKESRRVLHLCFLVPLFMMLTVVRQHSAASPGRSLRKQMIAVVSNICNKNNKNICILWLAPSGTTSDWRFFYIPEKWETLSKMKGRFGKLNAKMTPSVYFCLLSKSTKNRTHCKIYPLAVSETVS